MGIIHSFFAFHIWNGIRDLNWHFHCAPALTKKPNFLPISMCIHTSPVTLFKVNKIHWLQNPSEVLADSLCGPMLQQIYPPPLFFIFTKPFLSPSRLVLIRQQNATLSIPGPSPSTYGRWLSLFKMLLSTGRGPARSPSWRWGCKTEGITGVCCGACARYLAEQVGRMMMSQAVRWIVGLLTERANGRKGQNGRLWGAMEWWWWKEYMKVWTFKGLLQLRNITISYNCLRRQTLTYPDFISPAWVLLQMYIP